MKIACYTIAYNEELMLPHFIKHYKKFCDKIVVYDNMSTDNTKQIALDSGCDVIQWEAPGGGLNDSCYLSIKSNCYKADKDVYDWAIVLDCDEFITHKRGDDKVKEELENLKNNHKYLPDVEGYNMFSWDHDFTEDLARIQHAIPDKLYSKSVIFNPKLDMSWHPGCHISNLENDETNSGFVLKHYKFINYEYIVKRSKLFSERLSETNKRMRWGTHYLNSEQEWRKTFVDLDNRKIVYKDLA